MHIASSSVDGGMSNGTGGAGSLSVSLKCSASLVFLSLNFIVVVVFDWATMFAVSFFQSKSSSSHIVFSCFFGSLQLLLPESSAHR